MLYDSHLRRMNDLNRKVRPDQTHYETKIKMSIPQTDLAEVMDDYQRMISVMSRYERFLIFAQGDPIRILFFDDSRTNKLENGFPHTIHNIICLPFITYFELLPNERVELLIHEAIHIYQRKHVFEFNKFLINDFDMTVYDLCHETHANARYNPDINNILYTDNGRYTVMLLNSQSKTLSDTKLREIQIQPKGERTSTTYEELIKHFRGKINVQIEHPYESFACILAKHVFDGSTCPCSLCHKLTSFLSHSN